MISFKSPVLEAEWDFVAPELQEKLDALGHWVNSNRMPMVVLTCLGRTQDYNDTLPDSAKNSLHIPDADGQIRAADIRTRNYTTDQLSKIFAFLHEACPVEKWELITKVHGTAPHIHLGLRRKK